MDAKGRKISGVPGITFFHIFSEVVVCVSVVLAVVVVIYVYVEVDVAVDRIVVGVYFEKFVHIRFTKYLK